MKRSKVAGLTYLLKKKIVISFRKIVMSFRTTLVDSFLKEEEPNVREYIHESRNLKEPTNRSGLFLFFWQWYSCDMFWKTSWVTVCVVLCVAVCCSVLQCVAVRCIVLQCVVPSKKHLSQVVAECCVLQCVAPSRNTCLKQWLLIIEIRVTRDSSYMCEWVMLYMWYYLVL